MTFSAGALAQEAPPECGDSQVTGLVVNTINRNIRENPLIAARAGGIRAISVDAVAQVYADPAIRACLADVRRSDGVVENGYTVEWINRSSGEFAIQLVGADTLQARYGKLTAQSAPASAAANGYEACIEAAESTGEMIDCANAEAQRQDTRLNAAYKAAMAVNDKNALRTAQRQWIKDRDSQCAPNEDGGQMAGLEAADCVATMTAARADELEAMR
ncbi:DUF1311 domain-containing protein [Pusillimonas noertemannii]|nr:DUF1311 domain-containing protein [Pusillimonas noertemannii]TFL11096.1 DUF1311 domain-containing protein [Pusillimonas noertemannii]